MYNSRSERTPQDRWEPTSHRRMASYRSPTTQPQHIQNGHSRLLAAEEDFEPEPQPDALLVDHRPFSESQQDLISETSATHNTRDDEATFKAIPDPPNYPSLDYLPTMLKPGVTVSLAILYTCLLAGVAFLPFTGPNHLLDQVQDVNLYMAARFGPPLLSTIAWTSFRGVVSELLRMLPYINMAEGRQTSGKHSVGAVYWPYVRYQNTFWLRVWFVAAIMFQIVIGYGKSAVLQIINQDHAWTVIIHGAVAMVLAATFLVFAVVMIYLTFWLRTHKTGLRKDWDPQSIADTLSLFRWSDFQPRDILSEDRKHVYPDLRAEASRKVFRLGYWERRTGDQTQVVYGIRTVKTIDIRNSYKPEQKCFRTKKASEGYPYLCNPLDNFWLKFYSILATLLSAFFITVWATGYARHGFVLAPNWELTRLDRFNETELLAPTNITITGKFTWITSEANHDITHLLLVNFVLRSLPINLISLTLGYLYNMNSFYRYLQPFYNMTRKPCDASDSILLDYVSMNAVQVILTAYEKSHWKVLWLTLFELLRPYLINLPFGVLTITDTGRFIACTFSPSLYWTTFSVLVFFLISCVIAWPHEARRIPRLYVSLLDVWTMCSASRLATYPEFGTLWTKEELVATVRLRRDKYMLGALKGADGVDRPGFDIFSSEHETFPGEKEGVETGFVEHVEPKTRLQWRGDKGKDGDVEMPYVGGLAN